MGIYFPGKTLWILDISCFLFGLVFGFRDLGIVINAEYIYGLGLFNLMIRDLDAAKRYRVLRERDIEIRLWKPVDFRRVFDVIRRIRLLRELHLFHL